MATVQDYASDAYLGVKPSRAKRTPLPAPRPIPQRRDRRFEIQAKYDAAQTTDDHKNYWANADLLDADSANSRAVREKLVSRSRYEVGNNGYADGMVQTHANYMVGTGPRLRMNTASDAFNQMVEAEWMRWSRAALIRRKLWTMAHAKVQDGEAIALQVNNPRLRHRVQLDIKLIETEQCQSYLVPYGVDGYIDGIRFDEFGNPLWYDVLRHHPGSQNWYPTNFEPMQVPASEVLHWFQLRRPGQHRGVPEFSSTLNVGAGARRFREATIAAAETAADHALMLQTGFQPDELDLVSPMSTMEIEKRMMTALPMGWEASQLKAEHPNSTYESFNRAQISEQGRPKSMPFNVAAADSSNYNFASGKLDHLTWFRGIEVEREDCVDLVLGPLFEAWFTEAVLEFGWVWSRSYMPSHTWTWPELPVADEKARAIANKTNLEAGTVPLTEIVPDIDDYLAAQSRVYGVSVEEVQSALFAKHLSGSVVQVPEEVTEEEEEDDGEEA